MNSECCDKPYDLIALTEELLNILDGINGTLDNILGPQPTTSDCDDEKPSGILAELRDKLNRTLKAAKNIDTRVSCINDAI